MSEVKFNINGNVISLDSELITKGIELGEIKIENDFKIYSPEQFTEIEKEIRNDEYKNTKDKASEIFTKMLKSDFGIEAEGKDMKKVMETFKTKILNDANIEPNKRIGELEKDLETLRSNLTTKEKEFLDFQEGISKKEKQSKIESFILSKLPKEGTTLPAEKLIKVLAIDGYSFDFDEEGKVIPKLNNEIIKNQSTRLVENIDKVLNEAIEPYLVNHESGRGGNSSKGQKQSSIESFNEEMTKKGISIDSIEYNKEMSFRIANKTLTV